MYTLTDRANGDIISDASLDDFEILKAQLVQESEQDRDYYISGPTLDFLKESGLSESLVSALASRLNDRGLDVGWETTRVESVHTGTIVDDEGNPLGGIRIDLLGGLSDDEDFDEQAGISDWTYSRADGSYSIGNEHDDPGNFFRLSGRGDLVLDVIKVESIGAKNPFAVQTLVGIVNNPSAQPLSGVSVQLLNWELIDSTSSADELSLGGTLSWGDTQGDGSFAIPVRFPRDEGEIRVSLEVLAENGQSLLETTIEFDPQAALDLGILTCASPQENWNEDEELDPVLPDHQTFEHPLG